MIEEDVSRRKLYRSAVSSDPLALGDARIVVVGKNECRSVEKHDWIIESVDHDDRYAKDLIEAMNRFYWGSIEQDIFGRTYNVFDCDNYIVWRHENNDIAGNIAICNEDEGFLHIVVLHVRPELHGMGVGTLLVKKAVDEAKVRGFNTVKVATTNDNIPALYFYQRLGFTIENIVREVAAEDQNVPEYGFAGIPVRDEVQFRLDL